MKCKYCGAISLPRDQYCLLCQRSKYSGVKSKDRQHGNIFVALAVMLFIFYVFVFATDQRNYYDKNNFHLTVGKITHIRHGLFYEKSGDRYGIDIEYKYIVDGISYKDNSYSINTNRRYFSSVDDYKNNIENYPIGGDIEVFYYKGDPELSVLYLGNFEGYDPIKKGMPIIVFLVFFFLYRFVSTLIRR